jgi:hypothetical protein
MLEGAELLLDIWKAIKNLLQFKVVKLKIFCVKDMEKMQENLLSSVVG